VLLPVDDITVALAVGAHLQVGGVEAGIRLGNAETGGFLTANERREHALLLFLGTEYDDRIQAEQIEMYCRCPGETCAGFRHGLHHDRGFSDAEPAAAVNLRHRYAKPAAATNRIDEFLRKTSGVVAFEPIFGGKVRAELVDRIADGDLVVGELELHI